MSRYPGRYRLKPITICEVNSRVFDGYTVDPMRTIGWRRAISQWAYWKMVKWGVIAPNWTSVKSYRFEPPDLNNMSNDLLKQMAASRTYGIKREDLVLVLGRDTYMQIMNDDQINAVGYIDMRWENVGQFWYSGLPVYGFDTMVLNHVEGWAVIPKWIVYKERPKKDADRTQPDHHAHR